MYKTDIEKMIKENKKKYLTYTDIEESQKKDSDIKSILFLLHRFYDYPANYFENMNIQHVQFFLTELNNYMSNIDYTIINFNKKDLTDIIVKNKKCNDKLPMQVKDRFGLMDI